MTSDSTQPMSQRLDCLRREMRRRELDALIIPRADEHQGEYVPPSAQRLAWLTGFSGSAGAAVVLAARAAIFVDGRYTLQVRQEVDCRRFKPHHLVDHPPHRWLAENLAAGQCLGFDPWLHTPAQLRHLEEACAKAGARLVPCAANPVDAVWRDRPAAPSTPLEAQPERFAGQSVSAKLAEMSGLLRSGRHDACLLSAPESLAWLLNARAGDVPFTPLPRGFAILDSGGAVQLFMEPGRVGPEVLAGWDGAVSVLPPAEMEAALARLGAEARRVRLDNATVPARLHRLLVEAGAQVELADDPCALPRACKNPLELDGARAAHGRDGVAMVRFLAWLERETALGQPDEMEAAARLEEFRQAGSLFRGLSFPTISAAGPNGAIVHYHSTPATCRGLAPGDLYLVDSGAQYQDGTTDVTRTVLVGRDAPPEARHRFTLVLKGHIALASAVFPEGTTGSQLDALARQPLWREGLDYDHGTGHGVGSFLSVHEGPQRISKAPSTVALRPGMILSVEPGYYKAGAYGIRIENLVVVQTVSRPRKAERPLLGLAPLTLVPMDRRLVEVELLDPTERRWLNAYHGRVRDALMPHLDDPTERDWLRWATAEL